LRQHLRYNPKAEHYLLIGPYDHLEAQRGTRNAFGQQTEFISGYRRDPVALIDLVELRYQWFDYIFKGAVKPSILQDKSAMKSPAGTSGNTRRRSPQCPL
jgi:hypothetical protein